MRLYLTMNPYMGLIKMPGPVRDCLLWRLARVHQGSVRNYSTPLSVCPLTNELTFIG
jgi:hypothetical protein